MAGDLKARVINNIIKSLPQKRGKLSDDSLTDISNNVLDIIMHKNESELKKWLPYNQPLYFLSDKEILLYAKIKKIKGKIKKNKKLEEINNFIEKIEKKNPDIRHNIINALLGTFK